MIVARLLAAPTGLGALLAAPFTDRYRADSTAFTGAAIPTVVLAGAERHSHRRSDARNLEEAADAGR